MQTGQRHLTELTRAESLRLLGSVSLGRVVFTQHAMPAIRVVNHLVDGEDIIIRSHAGAAVVTAAGAADGLVVAYEADWVTADEHLGWSVVVTGRASLVGDPAEIARYRQVLSPWVAGEMDQVIRIRAEIVTGFRLGARPGAGAGLGA